MKLIIVLLIHRLFYYIAGNDGGVQAVQLSPQVVQLSQLPQLQQIQQVGPPQQHQQVRVISAALVHQLQQQGLTVRT